MRRRRVKITGIGPVTPAGIGREAFWKGIQEPVSRVRKLELPGGEKHGDFVATYLSDFSIDGYLSSISPSVRRAARHTHFALAGSALALQDAGIVPFSADLSYVAVFTGTSLMDFGAITKETDAVAKRGLKGVSPRLIYSSSVACIAAAIVDQFSKKGLSMAVQSSCCAGLDAVGQGAAMIAAGMADVVICGGTEAPLYKHPMIEFRAAELTPGNPDNPNSQSRPFDLWRTTGVIGEGAAMFILEAEDSPRPGFCWIDGYAFAADGDGGLCSGLITSMSRAMLNASIRRDEIEAISAWGPGHRIIDAAEASAIQSVFGESLSDISVYSIKGSVGNPLGAAPAIQIAAAALGLKNGVIPPTVNYQYADPSCRLPLSSKAQYLKHHRTIINAHGMAGMNSSMVLSACN